MPKQLHFVPNERVDLDDLTYGTSTFSVDEFKSHIQRLLTGDYHGGFILDGFRVEVTDATNREIRVHNGIALDREGRLITFEDGDNFSHNVDRETTLTLDSVVGDVYISVEFELVDSDSDTRAIWDPTFENPNIVDSANNQHASPNGKEFPLNVPTRRAKSWRVITAASFTDVTDPGTGALTLRIPLAILPVDGGGSIAGPVLEKPWTTIIETPQADGATLVCANTRLFAEGGSVTIKNKNDGSTIVSPIYLGNDSNNNAFSITNSGTDLEDVAVGDIVEALQEGTISISPTFLKAGSQYDCRPMLFSFTDPTAGSFETSALRKAPRNERYGAGAALLQDNISSKTLTAYPDATNTYFRRMVTEEPARVENDLKQSQDFFRALGTIIREVKYGETVDIKAQGGQPAVAGVDTSTSFTIRFDSAHPDWVGDLPAKLVGSTITVATSPGISPPVGSTAVVTAVDIDQPGLVSAGNELVLIKITVVPDAAWVGVPQFTMEFNITKGVASDTKYVDNYQTGNLHEVYKARIDKVVNTWTSDLQERLRANKMPIVTVGDGVDTFGDYIGDTGLSQALQDIQQLNKGGIIYIKRGSYTLTDFHNITSETILMGEGPDSTKITYANSTTGLFLTPFSSGTTADNIEFRDLSITAAAVTAPDTIGRGSIFYNWAADPYAPVRYLKLDNVHFHGGSMYNAGAFENQVYLDLISLKSSASNTTASQNIIITNSTFHSEGGGLYLQDCRDVKIDNCTFKSEDDDTAFVGMVQCIALTGNSGMANANYGSGVPARVPGEVSISNCTFMGEQTNTQIAPAATPVRGWIFTSPDYWGTQLSVTGCQFIGDWAGTLTPGALPLDRITIQSGAAIVNAAPIITNVSGCSFHSYNQGIISTAGRLLVSGCTFHELTTGVYTGWDADLNLIDWTAIGYTYAPPGATPSVHITGCSFTAKSPSNPSVMECIGINSNKHATTGPTGACEIIVSNCQVSGTDLFIDASDLYAYTSTVVGMFSLPLWKHISVTGCNFTGVADRLVVALDSSNRANTNFTQRDWAVEKITFSNNSDQTLAMTPSITALLDRIVLSARYVIFNNNSISDYEISGAASGGGVVNFSGGAEVLDFCGNSFSGCHSTSVASNLIHVKVAVSAFLSKFIINNNKIHTPQLTETTYTPVGIHNGFQFEPLTASIAAADFAAGALMVPTLEFNNNDINLSRANFVFLARQDDGANPFSYTWGEITCTGNMIRNNVSAVTSGFVQYGNDEQYNNRSGVISNYLGVEGAPLPAHPFAVPQGYLALLDFRHCGHPDEGFFETPSSAVITGNTLKLTGTIPYNNQGAPMVAPNDGYNQQYGDSVVGIRIAKWPTVMTVSNNVIHNAPLVLKWTFCTPRDNGVFGDPGGYKISVTGNTIFENNQANAVVVAPACGYAQAADSDDDIAINYTYLNFSSNQIFSSDAAIVGGPSSQNDYYACLGVVRLWFLDNLESGVAADTDTFATTGQYFVWTIFGNTFSNSSIRLEADSQAAQLTNLMDDSTVAPTTERSLSIQISGNVKLNPEAKGGSLFGYESGTNPRGLGYDGAAPVPLPAEVNSIAVVQNACVDGHGGGVTMIRGA